MCNLALKPSKATHPASPSIIESTMPLTCLTDSRFPTPTSHRPQVASRLSQFSSLPVHRHPGKTTAPLHHQSTMQTRITRLFKIQHPIVLPGMSWISKPKLVAAVCNAGGLGILSSGPLSAVETAAAIKEIRSLTDKPFGIGTTLMMPVSMVVESVAVLLPPIPSPLRPPCSTPPLLLQVS